MQRTKSKWLEPHMVQYKTLTLQSQYRDPSGHFAAPGWYVPNQRVPAGMINKAHNQMPKHLEGTVKCNILRKIL